MTKGSDVKLPKRLQRRRPFETSLGVKPLCNRRRFAEDIEKQVLGSGTLSVGVRYKGLVFKI